MEPVAETGRRLALLVATSAYSDPDLRQLRVPGHDADQLAEVLRDPRIGGFDVQVLINPASGEVQEGIEEFCSDGRFGDQLLIYLSCHGVLDSNARLYYTAANTRRQRLAATAVAAAWLNERLEDCRARRQILVLDCCHSGPFKGSKGDGGLTLQQRFEPHGRGRVVLTASQNIEYSFEGGHASGEGVPSVFTSAIVEGLRTGDADRDRDGRITVTELYQYVYDSVRAAEPRQTPKLWTYGAEGTLLVAHSARSAAIEPEPLPEDLRVALESPRRQVRESGVAELAHLLDGPRPGLALTARQILAQIAQEDHPQVATLADTAVGAPAGEAANQVRQELTDRARREQEERQKAQLEAEEKAQREAEEQRLRVLEPATDDSDGLVTSAHARLAPRQPTQESSPPRVANLPAPQAGQAYWPRQEVSVFEVAIGPEQTPGVFKVSVSSAVGEASAVVGLEARTLLARRAELELAVRASAVATRAVLPETERSLREVGQVLFAAMLGTGEVAGRYRAAAAVAAEREQELRVVLRIDDPVLAGLPWEAMYDQQAAGYVCQRDQLVRHVPVASAAAPLPVDPPLRILGVVSSPRGLQPLDVDKEQDLLEKALSRLTEKGLAEVVWAPSAMWADLQDVLLNGSWHVLHFIGHGDFDADLNEGVLALTGTDGRKDLVEASRLVTLLRQARPRPRLVVLNSCSGAAVGVTDLFSGTAAALVRGGVSAVAAMQYAITDPAAVAFARGFYSAIARGRGVDDAVSSGRVAIVGLSGLTLEWVTPVLYLRGHDSRLFTVPTPPPSRRPGHPAPG